MWEVGGLEGAAEDGDSVVLGGNIVEGFGAAEVLLVLRRWIYHCNAVGVLFLNPWL